MKKTIILALLFLGCTSKESSPISETATIEVTDSVIIKSQQSAKNLDSITNETTEKVTSNVEKLTELVKVYETKIKTKSKTITVTKQVIIHDTIYIETKKNFWGKEKKKTTTSSDSTTNQIETNTSDSTITE